MAFDIAHVNTTPPTIIANKGCIKNKILPKKAIRNTAFVLLLILKKLNNSIKDNKN